MKLVKRLLAGMMAVVVMLGVGVVFSGCSEVKGNTYAFDHLTYTIITAVSEESGEKEITETRTLTAREYYIINKNIATLENLATATLTEKQEKEFQEWYEAQIENIGSKATTTYEFSGKEVKEIDDEINKITGEITRSEIVYAYKEEGGVITLTKDNTPIVAPEGSKLYEISNMYLLDGKVAIRDYNKNITTSESYEVNKLLYTSVVYAEV